MMMNMKVCCVCRESMQNCNQLLKMKNPIFTLFLFSSLDSLSLSVYFSSTFLFVSHIHLSAVKQHSYSLSSGMNVDSIMEISLLKLDLHYMGNSEASNLNCRLFHRVLRIRLKFTRELTKKQKKKIMSHNLHRHHSSKQREQAHHTQGSHKKFKKLAHITHIRLITLQSDNINKKHTAKM